MLKVSGDGRNAALDMRLVKNAPTSEYDVLDLLNEEGAPTKIDAVADRVARTWAANQDRTYLIARTDEPHPRPGALQMVFCDLGTPRDDWNVYDELKNQLVDRGVPPDQIAGTHYLQLQIQLGMPAWARRPADCSIWRPLFAHR